MTKPKYLDYRNWSDIYKQTAVNGHFEYRDLNGGSIYSSSVIIGRVCLSYDMYMIAKSLFNPFKSFLLVGNFNNNSGSLKEYTCIKTFKGKENKAVRKLFSDLSRVERNLKESKNKDFAQNKINLIT